MKLVIVESPTKERIIQKYLGEGYTVQASLGHVRDLAKEGKYNLGVDIDHDFEVVYEDNVNRATVIRKLKKAAEGAEEVLLATDPDREGEAISWHLSQVLNLDPLKTKRVVFNEITQYGITEGITHPRNINLDTVNSQETRRIIDRILGFRLSYLLQSKIRSRSAGRVQSAVLKIIVDREREIENFIPKEYWNVAIDVMQNESKTTAKLISIADDTKFKIENKEACDAILAKIGDKVIVKSLKTETKEHYARPPFTTSTLQQDAFYQFKFSIDKTMKVAQSLFEGVDLGKHSQGLITYMRTDSIRLSPLFISIAKKKIAELYGEEYIGTAYRQKTSEKVQDAHEGIRPTDVNLTPDSIKKFLNPDQFKLYSLIYARAMASMMKPRVENQTTVLFTSDDLVFESVANELVFNGYSKVYGEFENKMKYSVLKFVENAPADVVQVLPEQLFTKAPSRFNEGQIVKVMEESNIGRPSTYVATIDILKKRYYVLIKKGYIEPTEQGKLTVVALEQYFENLVDAKYTAGLEKKLDEIEEGTAVKLAVLHEFNDEFEEKFHHALHTMEKVEAIEVGENCPKCGKPLVFRKGKYGEFVGCSGYPDCNYIKPTEPVIPENAKTCPKCGLGKLVVRRGKYGNFLACNRYPDCDYKEKFNNPAKTTRKYTKKS